MIRCAAVLAAFVAAVAGAEESDRGFYAGADVAVIDASAGRSHGILVGTPQFIVRAFPDSATVGGTDISWGAQIGYRINRFLAVELAYTDFGSMVVSETYDLSSILGAPVIFESEVHFGVSGPSLSWLGQVPLGKRFEAFVRVGVLHADQEVDRRPRAVLPGQTSLERASDDVPIFGVGAAFQATQAWSVRIEYQHVDGLHGGDFIDGTDSLGPIRVRRYGLGIAYRF